MSKLIIAPRLIVALLTTVAFAACSGQSPVTPTSSSVAAGALDARSAQVPGVYELTFNVFRNGIYQEVSVLPVSSQELSSRPTSPTARALPPPPAA